MPSYLKIDQNMTSQEKRQQCYREKFKQLQPSWDDTMIVFLRLFREVVKPDMTLLDLGCGRGNVVVDDFRSSIKEAIGIDADQSAVDGNASMDKIVIGNVEHLPFSDAYFDVVISQWVIEHLEHPEKVFAECYRVLKPGGSFLFVTPYAYSSILVIKRMFGSSFTKKILKWVYGREEQDCFETMYRANTVAALESQLSYVGFQQKELIQNPDPSYWAFNDFFFRIALFFEKYFSKHTKMHIIGLYRK